MTIEQRLQQMLGEKDFIIAKLATELEQAQAELAATKKDTGSSITGTQPSVACQ